MIDERGEWRHALTNDLEHMHTAIQGLLSQMAQPPLPPLQTPNAALGQESPQTVAGPNDVGLSCDNSPRLSPRADGLPHVPIESLYQITRLRALRSDDAPNEPRHSPNDPTNQPLNDFITKGLIIRNDAERLVDLYVHRIDHFMYMIGSGPYRDLESMRCASPILTAAVCTVAALHDPMGSHLYGICSREFRRLMSAAMFDRHIDRDHMRAMVRPSRSSHITIGYLPMRLMIAHNVGSASLHIGFTIYHGHFQAMPFAEPTISMCVTTTSSSLPRAMKML